MTPNSPLNRSKYFRARDVWLQLDRPSFEHIHSPPPDSLPECMTTARDFTLSKRFSDATENHWRG